MEALGSTVKSDLADRFDGFGETTMVLFDDIEMFYNPRRRHLMLRPIIPAAYVRTSAAYATRPREWGTATDSQQ